MRRGCRGSVLIAPFPKIIKRRPLCYDEVVQNALFERIGEVKHTMIARLWHGWTTAENADAYEALLRTRILPGIHRVDGYQGAYLLRTDGADEVEFITLTLFESMDAVRAFAGADHEGAVVPPEARALLLRFDETSQHYEAIWCP